VKRGNMEEKSIEELEEFFSTLLQAFPDKVFCFDELNRRLAKRGWNPINIRDMLFISCLLVIKGDATFVSMRNVLLGIKSSTDGKFYIIIEGE